MKKLIYLMMGVGLLFAISACSDDSSPASVTITGESGEEVALNGTWASPDGCDSFTDESQISSQTFSGSGFSFSSEQYFSVTDCSGTSDLTLAGGGSFVLGDTVDADLEGDTVTAYQTDITTTSLTATPNTEDGVSGLEGFCGVTDAAIGTASDLTGTSCDDSTDGVEKDLTYVDDSADPDRLYGSYSDAPTDSDGYPTALSGDYLERQ